MVCRTLLVCALLASCPAAFAEDAKADLKKEAMVGRPAPDFTATGVDGRKFTLSEKLKSGNRNIVLLFSRASW